MDLDDMWKWKSVIRYAFLSAIVTSEFPQYRRGHHWEMLCLAWIDARVQQHCDMNSNIHERTAMLGEQCVSDVINCEQVSWCAMDRVNFGENLRTLEFFNMQVFVFLFLFFTEPQVFWLDRWCYKENYRYTKSHVCDRHPKSPKNSKQTHSYTKNIFRS